MALLPGNFANHNTCGQATPSPVLYVFKKVGGR